MIEPDRPAPHITRAGRAGPARRYEVLVRYQTGEMAAEFAQARKSQVSLHQSVAAVSGLGDGACRASYTASKPASNTLGAGKGGIAIFITSPASPCAERARDRPAREGVKDGSKPGVGEHPRQAAPARPGYPGRAGAAAGFLRPLRDRRVGVLD